MFINYQKIYEKLGYLFYAMAAADGHVRKEETSALRKIIEDYWLPFENSTDEFDTDAAQYIFFSFDYLNTEGESAGEAYRIFEDYYNEHKNAFNKTLRHKILSTATAVAKAFRASNEKESVYLEKMKQLFVTNPIHQEK